MGNAICPIYSIYCGKEDSWNLLDCVVSMLCSIPAPVGNSSMLTQKFPSVRLRTLVCRADGIWCKIFRRFLNLRSSKKRSYQQAIRRTSYPSTGILHTFQYTDFMTFNLQSLIISSCVISNIILVEILWTVPVLEHRHISK
jgi:hypothetical protein